MMTTLFCVVHILTHAGENCQIWKTWYLVFQAKPQNVNVIHSLRLLEFYKEQMMQQCFHMETFGRRVLQQLLPRCSWNEFSFNKYFIYKVYCKTPR